MAESLIDKIDKNNIPTHVAIIMDGNGRWAKERGLDRVFGHQNAIQSVRDVTEAAAEIGVKYLTLYTFSTENWNRPQKEVHALMDLLVKSIEQETETLNKNNISLKAIGDLTRLPINVWERLQRCIKNTNKNTRMSLVLALSYSARWEIIEAIKTIASHTSNNGMTPVIDEEFVSNHLTTKGIPDPDLLIRTSGEERISNFMLWQIAYTELYFTKQNWPDFHKESFYEAIIAYQNRQRRFGKTGEQVVK